MDVLVDFVLKIDVVVVVVVEDEDENDAITTRKHL